jgi:crossover junction endodeoxyribonuclease RuvC
MIIMGIDPGSRNLGYSFLRLEQGRLELLEAGLLKIPPGELQEQIVELAEGLDLLLTKIRPDEVAIEDIFYAFNPKTVLKLAQFRGALSLKILQEVGYFYEYTPLQVKKALTGNGKAAKEQVAYMVKRLLGIRREIKPLDITDAMAIAITHAQRVKLRRQERQ